MSDDRKAKQEREDQQGIQNQLSSVIDTLAKLKDDQQEFETATTYEAAYAALKKLQSKTKSISVGSEEIGKVYQRFKVLDSFFNTKGEQNKFFEENKFASQEILSNYIKQVEAHKDRLGAQVKYDIKPEKEPDKKKIAKEVKKSDPSGFKNVDELYDAKFQKLSKEDEANKLEKEKQIAVKLSKLYEVIKKLDGLIMDGRDHIITNGVHDSLEDFDRGKKKTNDLHDILQKGRMFVPYIKNLKEILETQPPLPLPPDMKSKISNMINFATDENKPITLNQLVSASIDIRNVIITAHNHILVEQKDPLSPIYGVTKLGNMPNDIEKITLFNSTQVSMIQQFREQADEKLALLDKAFFPNSVGNIAKKTALALIRAELSKNTGDISNLYKIILAEEEKIKPYTSSSSFNLLFKKSEIPSTLQIIHHFKGQIVQFLKEEKKADVHDQFDQKPTRKV